MSFETIAVQMTQLPTQSIDDPPTRTATSRRLGVKHLFAVTAIAAVIFAVLGALLRGTSTKLQLAAYGQSVLIVVMAIACVGYVFHKRQKVERQAGATIERFGSAAGRILYGLALIGFASLFVVQGLMEWENTKPGEVPNLVPNPWFLFLFINFAVVRIWWRIDPLAIEACEHGLVRGGLTFLPWTDIRRYTWSGRGGRQLNLFSTSRQVSHHQVEASARDRLDELLRVRTASPAPPMPGSP